MKDKKKLILIALAIVVLGVGAFQFTNMSGGDKPEPKPVAKKEPAEEPDETNTQADPATQYAILSTSARDPFQEGVLPLAEGQTPPPKVQPLRPPSGIKGSTRFALPGGLDGFNPLKPPIDPNTGIGINPLNAFDVIGAIEGEHPAAVFVDESGRQRLVTVGGSFGDDRHLVSVNGDRVVVRHKDKLITYTVGGTPNAK